jgi:uncharacterized repeat protein (TIGR03803 family)
MKSFVRKSLLVPVLVIVLGCAMADQVRAQTFKTLHSFMASRTALGYWTTNSDGSSPISLILSGNTLYGTASYGGTAGNGTVFALSTDGTRFKILHTFTASYTNGRGFYTNTDGATPTAGLILSGDALYGTTGSKSLSPVSQS